MPRDEDDEARLALVNGTIRQFNGLVDRGYSRGFLASVLSHAAATWAAFDMTDAYDRPASSAELLNRTALFATQVEGALREASDEAGRDLMPAEHGGRFHA